MAKVAGSERHYIWAGRSDEVNRIEQLKEIIRACGENSEEILSKGALMRGNITRTEEQTQTHQTSALATELKELVKREK